MKRRETKCVVSTDARWSEERKRDDEEIRRDLTRGKEMKERVRR